MKLQHRSLLKISQQEIPPPMLSVDVRGREEIQAVPVFSEF